MERLEIAINDNNRGEIQLFLEDKKIGKMDISVSSSILTVYHTEVDEAYGGKGYAKLLLEKLVSYAREKGLKINPLCPYVHAQFKRREEDYADVWYKKD